MHVTYIFCQDLITAPLCHQLHPANDLYDPVHRAQHHHSQLYLVLGRTQTAMPPLRPITRTFPLAFSSTQPARSTPLIYSITAQSRTSLPANAQPGHAFSNSAVKRSGAEPHYDPPTGWLWGIPPGEKREPEGWEKLWVWGFWGSLGVAVVAYAYKPDTS
jgi:hypothetical protein